MRTNDDLARELDDLKSAVLALLAHGEAIHKEKIHEANRTGQALGREYSTSWAAARQRGRESLGLPFLPVSRTNASIAGSAGSAALFKADKVATQGAIEHSIEDRADMIGLEFENFFKDRGKDRAA